MARKKRSVLSKAQKKHKKATGTTGFTVEEIEQEFIAEAITACKWGKTQKGNTSLLFHTQWQGCNDLTWEPETSFGDQLMHLVNDAKANFNAGPCPKIEEVEFMDSALFAEVDQLAEETKKKEKAQKRKATAPKKNTNRTKETETPRQTRPTNPRRRGDSLKRGQ